MDPTKFILHINNDASGAISLTPTEVFVDGKPHLMGDGPVSIDRRGEIEVKFSDVAQTVASRAHLPVGTIDDSGSALDKVSQGNVSASSRDGRVVLVPAFRTFPPTTCIRS